MERRLVAAALCALLVLAGTAPGTVGAASGDDTTIDETTSVALTPSEPGSIAVETRYVLPGAVESLTVYVPETATVTAADGFEQVDDSAYDWSGETSTPSLEFSYRVNETSEGGRGSHGQQGTRGYAFVDAGPWALFDLPRTGESWEWRGEGDVATTTTYRAAGEGYFGTAMGYLGPHRTVSRTAAGQDLTLVVPQAASMTASTDEVLQSLASASETLRVGERDPSVNFFVAPSDSAPWSANGLSYGDTDSWVLDNASLDSPSNTWLHEYVHSRQDYSLEREMRWFTEASAEYFAALLTLQQGRIGYDAYRRHLSHGRSYRFAESVLARPETWAPGAQYFRGALVLGALDREMRTETGGRATVADLFAEVNRIDESVTGPMFEAMVRDRAGDRVAEQTADWVTSDDPPATWSESAHREAFDTVPPRLDVTLGGGDGPTFRVSGPYGERSTDATPTLYPGETLRVTVTAENTGDVGGPEWVTLETVSVLHDTVPVDLGPGDSTTVTLAATAPAPGTHAFVAGTERFTVTVSEPAPVTVTDATANRTTVAPGDPVRVTATVAANETTPSHGTVAVTVDGETTRTETVTLAAGAETTVTQTVTFTETGEHTVGVGDASVTVTVSEGGDGNGGTPGFGVGVALVALVAAALAARYR
jgi:PGF-CTERM protein